MSVKSILLSFVIMCSVLFNCQQKKEEKVELTDTLKQEEKRVFYNTDIARPIYKIDSLLILNDTISALAAIKENGIDINASHENYGTFLFRFVTGGRSEDELPSEIKLHRVKPSLSIVNFLLKHGANPDVASKFLMTDPLAGSDYYSDPVTCDSAISELLISKNSKCQLNQSIFCAVSNKNKAAIIRALDRGLNPTYALPYAYKYDRAFFEDLLQLKIDMDAALSLACGRVKSPDIETGAGSSFLVWEYEADTTLIRRLVKLGAKPSIAIDHTIYWKYSSLTDFLIKEGADKNAALSSACYHEDTVWVKKLVGLGAKLSGRNDVPFSKSERLRSLVLPVTDGRVYSEVFSGGGEGGQLSSLMDACKEDKLDAVTFMLKTGANPNEYCGDCWWGDDEKNCECKKVSALALAYAHASDEMVTLLKKYKAKLPKGCPEPKFKSRESEPEF